jgi:4-hydroxybenzoate polyprenyltransferase
VAPFLSAWQMILFAQLFLLGVAYSAPPLRLKDRPLAGLFANAYAFGALIPLAATREISFDSSYLPAWSLAAYFTLAVAGVHILTTLPDREGDRATGKKTVAGVMSGKMAKLLALLFIAASAVVAFRLGYALLMYISIFTVIVLAMSLMYTHPSIDYSGRGFLHRLPGVCSCFADCLSSIFQEKVWDYLPAIGVN